MNPPIVGGEEYKGIVVYSCTLQGSEHLSHSVVHLHLSQGINEIKADNVANTGICCNLCCNVLVLLWNAKCDEISSICILLLQVCKTKHNKTRQKLYSETFV